MVCKKRCRRAGSGFSRLSNGLRSQHQGRGTRPPLLIRVPDSIDAPAAGHAGPSAVNKKCKVRSGSAIWTWGRAGPHIYWPMLVLDFSGVSCLGQVAFFPSRVCGPQGPAPFSLNLPKVPAGTDPPGWAQGWITWPDSR